MEISSRVFKADEYIKSSNETPTKSVVLETSNTLIVIWTVLPGQEIAAHIHPTGQDSWIVLFGSAEYYISDSISTQLSKGQVAVAKPYEIHGAINSYDEPFIFISLLSPSNAGYQSVIR
ncbi:MAG: cupin domain-containing protein [Spirochaetota bacterium]|nr:cupin domain-containing protein [Spirochaetota bacterium]